MKAFRQQSLLVHPDKNIDASAGEAFRRVQNACEALRAELDEPGQPTASDEGWTQCEIPAAHMDWDNWDMDGDLWDYYYWRRQQKALAPRSTPRTVTAT